MLAQLQTQKPRLSMGSRPIEAALRLVCHWMQSCRSDMAHVAHFCPPPTPLSCLTPEYFGLPSFAASLKTFPVTFIRAARHTRSVLCCSSTEYRAGSMKKSFKDKLRRGKEHLRGSQPAGDANIQSSTHLATPSAGPDDDSLSRRSDVSASVMATNDVSPEPESATSAALALPIIQRKPDLWSRARDKLPAKDKEWLATASADDGVDNIITLIKKRRDEAKEWTEVGDTASSALAWLHKFREIGDVVSSYDPVHLALPWAGVRFILQCTLAHQENVMLAMESAEQTARVVHRCQIYELLYPQESALESVLVDLYTSLLVLHVRVGRFLSHSVAGRSSSAISKPHHIEDLMSNMVEMETKVDKEVAVCQSKQVSEIRIQSEEIRKRLQTLSELGAPLLRVDQNVLSVLNILEVDKLAKVLTWISPIPYNLHHKHISESRTNETCEWAIERPQFREWISESQSITLWLQAPGKSFYVLCFGRSKP